MGDVLRFPRDRQADLRIDICDPGPSDELNASVRGKVPPHNLDAEAAVIAAVFDLPDVEQRLADQAGRPEMVAVIRKRIDAVTVAIEMLRPEHFYSESNARIWQAMQHLGQRHTPVDLHTVLAWLRDHGWTQKVGGEAYVTMLAREIPTTGYADAHARILVDLWERRALIASTQKIGAELYEDVDNWPAQKAAVRAEIGRLTVPRVTVVGGPIGAAADEARAEIDVAQRGAEPGVPWGFETLDAFGLLGMGKQHILAARPGMGKTALMFQGATRIARTFGADGIGEAVYVCSWEMLRADLIVREACSLAGVSYKALQRRRVSPGQVEEVGRVLGWLRELPIWIDDKRCSPGELAGRVAMVKAMFERGAARRAPDADGTPGALYPKCRMRVVAIDQLSEVLPPADANPRWQKREIVGATAKALQDQVAKKLRVATLLLCQLARPQAGAKIEEPALHELRESGAIEEAADEVYAIHRRDYYEGKRCPPEWQHVAKVIPLKGRYGVADEALMGFYGGKFSDDLPPGANGEPHYGGN